MFNRRRKGTLMHITSLPGPYGCGDMGPEARKFASLIAGKNFSVWQILPTGPVEGAFGYSPYTSPSAFAGNFLLISPDDLEDDGLLRKSELEPRGVRGEKIANLQSAARIKLRLLRLAYAAYLRNPLWSTEMEKFKEEAKHWLKPWCRFTAFKERFGSGPWTSWPKEIRDNDGRAVMALERETPVAERMAFEEFVQFIFHMQSKKFHDYCNDRGVLLMGDLPIYVAADSADAWSNRSLFDLDEEGAPRAVAGVPPDYFSPTGQRWGNALYKWDVMKDFGYRWWINRIKRMLSIVDCVRIDHFRGFCGYWSIPADDDVATNGHWEDGPGTAFFDALHAAFDIPHIEELPVGSPTPLPIVAEDLGIITDDVRELMIRYRIPGMKVLQFAFGGSDDNPYLPYNHEPMSIVYTGTHDNNTTAGWWLKDATSEEKNNLSDYADTECNAKNVNEIINRMAITSVSRLAIIPFQDLLGLTSAARMNTPSVKAGNWAWRVTEEQLVEFGKQTLSKNYGRN